MTTKNKTVASVRKQLEKAATIGAAAFYDICEGICWLQANKDWQDLHNGDFDAMNEEIDRYLRGWPGMNRSVAKKMFDLYPNKEDWGDPNVIYLEARQAMTKRLPRPPRQEMEVDTAPISPGSENETRETVLLDQVGPKKDILDRVNPGGGTGGLSVAQNEAREQRIRELEAEVVELKTENQKLKILLAEERLKNR